MESVSQGFAIAETRRDRLYAALRIVGFVVLAYGLGSLAVFVLKHTAGLPGSMDALMVVGDWLLFLIVLATTAAMAVISGRPFSSYGLGGKGRIRKLAIGALAGGLLLGGEILILSVTGHLSFEMAVNAPLPLVGAGLLYILIFAGVALLEETLFRGYALVELSRALSFWPAAILAAALFGGAHLLNGSSENYIGAASAGLFGLVFAISFRLTGSLWLAIGLHFGWNYTQSFVFGMPNSGLTFDDAVMRTTAQGPDWLTGGSVGPEGSVLVLAPLVAIMLIAWLLRERPASAEAAA